VLDVFQSAGVLPLALRDWGVDAAVGGCLKWLCGGPGNCFLYVDPDRAATLEPAITGWWRTRRRSLSSRRRFAGVLAPAGSRTALPRCRRSTPRAPVSTSSPRSECEQVREVGRHDERLLAEARRRGYECSLRRRSGAAQSTVAVDVPDGRLVARELLRRDLVIDYRPGFGIRIAPHFYNTAGGVLTLVDAPSTPSAPTDPTSATPSRAPVHVIFRTRAGRCGTRLGSRVVARLGPPQASLVLAIVHRRAILVFGSHEVRSRRPRIRT
jgi:kynureninase